jgi:hypothetical protein
VLAAGKAGQQQQQQQQQQPADVLVVMEICSSVSTSL